MEMIHTIGVPGGPEMLFIFVIAPFLVIIFALIDILKNEFDPHQNKLIWLIVVLAMPLLGAILYYAIGRKSKIDPQKQF